jgi:hypothetical protein
LIRLDSAKDFQDLNLDSLAPALDFLLPDLDFLPMDLDFQTKSRRPEPPIPP